MNKVPRMIRFFIALSACCLYCTAAAQDPDAGQARTLYFNDDFTLQSISNGLWCMTYITNGERWTAESPEIQLSAGGPWVAPSVTAPMPVWADGTLTMTGSGGGAEPPDTFGLGLAYAERAGAARACSPSLMVSPLASAGAQTIFPYIYAGAPATASPIPPTGDFTFEIAITFTSIGGNGTGFVLIDNTTSNGATPTGDNIPGGSPNLIAFQAWAATNESTGLWSSLSNPVTNTPIIDNITNPTNVHVYTFMSRLNNTEWLEYIDGVEVASVVSKTTLPRPNTIWLGNPVLNTWAVATPWSSPSYDYVRVTVP